MKLSYNIHIYLTENISIYLTMPFACNYKALGNFEPLEHLFKRGNLWILGLCYVPTSFYMIQVHTIDPENGKT